MSTGNSDPARWKNVPVEVGGIQLASPLRVYEIKQLSPSERRIITSVQAISKSAERGDVELYVYDELMCESLLGRQGWRGNLTPLAAFRKQVFLEIPSPLNRSKFNQTANWVKGDEVDRFIDFLLDVDENKLVEVMRQRSGFTDFELMNATKLQEFKTLCSDKLFGKNKRRDAYHFWSAECSGIDYFLTVDMKFVNTYKNALKHNQMNMGCIVITPEELTKMLDISEVEIHIPESGKMFQLNGLEYRN